MIARLPLVAAAVLLPCCGDDESGVPDAPLVDPFDDIAVTPLASAARSLALVPGEATARAVVVQEIAREVTALSLSGASLVPTGSFTELAGPRAACALGSLVVVADATAGELVLLDVAATPITEVRRVGGLGVPTALACGDVDGDGAPDVVAITGVAEAALVAYRGPLLEPLGGALDVPGASRLTLGDLDGDGDDDAVVVSAGLGSATFLLADGSLQVAREVTGLPEPQAASIADGRAAIACSGSVRIFADPLGEGAPEEIPDEADLYDLALGDLDEDGLLDVATVGIATHRLTLHLAIGTPRAASFSRDVPRGPVALAARDVDGDGALDLVVLSYEQPSITWLPSAGAR